MSQIQHDEIFSDRINAEKRQAELSLLHGLTKNLYRRVSNKETGEEWYEMSLSRGETMHFDTIDLPKATMHTWYARGSSSSKKLYARGKIDGKGIDFHTFITSFPLVDHIDRDPLNNRRGNLRTATHSENSRNCGRSATNTTGRAGVAKSSRGYYIANWTTFKGKYHAKYFSCKQLGEEVAFQQAVAFRMEMERKYYRYVQAPDDDSTLPHQAPEMVKVINKPFSCPKCTYTGSSKWLLTLHLKSKHSE
jgi:hypothetical protein